MDKVYQRYFRTQLEKHKSTLLNKISNSPASPCRYIVQVLPNDQARVATVTYDKVMGKFIRIVTSKSTLEL